MVVSTATIHGPLSAHTCNAPVGKKSDLKASAYVTAATVPKAVVKVSVSACGTWVFKGGNGVGLWFIYGASVFFCV